MRAWLLAFVFAAFASHAHAALIYEWVPAGSKPAGFGQVSFEDGAFDDGRASFRGRSASDTVPEPITGTEILQFTWGYDIQAAFGPGTYLGDWDMEFVLEDGALTGSVFGNDIFTGVTMSGDAALWTVSHFATDAPGPCNASENDCQATGYWQLVGGPSPVPEPVSAAVLMGGLLGLAALRRRRDAPNAV